MKKSLSIIIFVLLAFLGRGIAQVPCHSSFKFVKADTTRMAIDTANGHHYYELYDSSGFTWEAWLYLSDTDTVNNVIIGVEDAVTDEDIWLSTGYNGPGSRAQLNFTVYANSMSSTHATAYGATHLSPNTWYHVAAVCDYNNTLGGGATLTIYVNGVVDGVGVIPATFADSMRLTRDITTSLGNFNSVSTRSISASVDEVKFWKGARSKTQIWADSAGCSALPQAGLVAYFKADEGTGTNTVSFIDNNFYGTNHDGWGVQAPVTICNPVASVTSPSVSICTHGTAGISVSVTGLRPNAPWSVTLSDGSVISGTSDSSGYGSGSEIVAPAATTTYTITSLLGDSCAVLSGFTVVTVKKCDCNPIINIPATACVGDAGQLSIGDLCHCIDTAKVRWIITDPLSNVITITGATVTYTFSLPGTYQVCVTWSDKCKARSFRRCDSVVVTNCCKCDMKISEAISSTDCTNGFINGALYLYSGSKNVVSVEMSIMYFNYDFAASGCKFNCDGFNTGYPLGNFVKTDPINGVPSTMVGCFGSTFSREADWQFTPSTNISQTINYVISIPKSACHMNYDYCIKVLIHYDDCSTCECTICFSADSYYCGCSDGSGKRTSKASDTKAVLTPETVAVFPNPNGGKFTVEMNKTTDSKVILLEDMLGKIVTKSIVDGDMSTIEFNNIVPGTYNVVITGSDTTVTKKVVVIK